MIRILFAEDLPADAEMARREIQNQGIAFDYRLVDTEEEFRDELTQFNPDIVISDYSMPPFDGLKALEIAREFRPSIPFIILTGSLNEETAVYCMKAGANDYVLKEKIKRLPFALREAIEKARIEQEKENYQTQLQTTLNDYTDLINGMTETIWIVSLEGEVLDVNNTAVKKLGYTREELTKIGLAGVDNQFSEAEIRRMSASMKEDVVQFFHTQHITKQGEVIPVEISSSLIHYQGGSAVLCVVRDISDRLNIEGRLRLLSRSVE
ncbi:MAG: PAS domain S-box protein, partial [Bacteroidales bacterium]